MLQGNICALLAAKDHVNVFLYDGAIVPDPEGIITAGHDNKTARTVAFRQGETDQRARLDRDVPADHRQQPGRWLAQAQAGTAEPTANRGSRRPRPQPRGRPSTYRRTVVRSNGRAAVILVVSTKSP